MGYFKITDLGNGIWRISERLGVSEYLIVGTEKALLIDTGFSYGKSFLKKIHTITALPLIVVNTHYHPDHSGKNNLFNDVYINKMDDPNGKNEAQILLRNIRKAQPIRGIKYSIIMRCPKTKANYIYINDGTKFQLGNRDVGVIDMPGHTPGSIMLLDEKTKTVISGDAVNSGTWLFTNESKKVGDYAKELHSLYDRLITLGYKSILFSHSAERFDIGFIKEYADFIDTLDISQTKILKFKGLPDTIHIGAAKTIRYGNISIFCYEKQF